MNFDLKAIHQEWCRLGALVNVKKLRLSCSDLDSENGDMHPDCETFQSVVFKAVCLVANGPVWSLA